VVFSVTAHCVGVSTNLAYVYNDEFFGGFSADEPGPGIGAIAI
jgi:hypothetical protein